MRILTAIFTGLIVAVLAAVPASAHAFEIGDIAIDDLSVRAMIPGAKVGGGYLRITNRGAQDDRLVSITSPRAGSVQVHEMRVTNDVMVMREIPEGLPVPAGQTVELKPGGYHLMFMDVPQPFKVDETVAATLTFEKSGQVEVVFAVGSAGGRMTGAIEGNHAGADALPSVTDPAEAITAVLKNAFETADKPLTVEPVVVEGGWAIAGWLQDGRGGRVLLKNADHGWRVHLCSGEGLKDAAVLQKIGLSPADATALASHLATAEAGLDPQAIARFDSFEGTVMMDAESPADAPENAHSDH